MVVSTLNLVETFIGRGETWCTF